MVQVYTLLEAQTSQLSNTKSEFSIFHSIRIHAKMRLFHISIPVSELSVWTTAWTQAPMWAKCIKSDSRGR